MYEYMCVWVYTYIHHTFIHSFVDGHLDCFHVLTIVSSAAMNISFFFFNPEIKIAFVYLKYFYIGV